METEIKFGLKIKAKQGTSCSQNFSLKASLAYEAFISLIISVCICNFQLNNCLEKGKFWHIE